MTDRHTNTSLTDSSKEGDREVRGNKPVAETSSSFVEGERDRGREGGRDHGSMN